MAITVISVKPVRNCPEKGVRKKAFGGSSILSTKLRMGTDEYLLSLISYATTDIK